jgi:hypothetical protein
VGGSNGRALRRNGSMMPVRLRPHPLVNNLNTKGTVMGIEISELGLTKEELRDLVVEKIANDMLRTRFNETDEEGEEVVNGRPSPFAKELSELVRTTITKAVEDHANRHLLPRVQASIETICMTQTNEWGQKKGKTFTFLEYLVDRAENYMREPVNHSGKTREEEHNYSWSACTTRVAYMIEQFLHRRIEEAMKGALKTANESIVKGIADAVKIKLAEVQASLQVSVKTK